MRSSITILAIGLVAVTTRMATVAKAQSPLEAHLILRPLTAVDVKTYGLPSDSELSGGLSTVGIGTAVYLEADVNQAFPASNIVRVAWSLTSKPTGSATTLQTSPLGANVPIYSPSDRLVYQVAARKLLRPDIVGQYVVTATVTTSNETTNLTQTITASTYMGVATCELCHSGGQIAPDKWTTWVTTLHAQVFSNEIDGVANFTGVPMRQSCLQCHTTGYDVLGTNAPDGGFNDLAEEHGWTIPAVLTNGNWVSMQKNYPAVAALANVQCESCHGPGYRHASGLGNTNFISVSYVSADCQQCHDDAPYHPYGTEWLHSVHAVTTRIPAGDPTCVKCHTGIGFVQHIEGVTNNLDTDYMPINCTACHEPHGQTIPPDNPHMIRTLASVTLKDGTVVTNGGEGLLCMQCHHARQDAATYAVAYHPFFGPHHGPQADMLEGVNGFTYGKNIPSSDHAAIANTCVTCHMQTVPSTDPAFLHAGAHTFEMSYQSEDLVAACQQCHGPTLTSFDFPVEQFDGSGVFQGVQTQVQNLLNKLSALLPPVGTVKTSLDVQPTWTTPQLEAAYNWMFVNNDGSLGVHNTAYAVGLLQASIADLTGISVPGGLPDAWVIKYFGSVDNPAGAPDAINNTNGVPNWMMYALGLNPTHDGITVPGGVVWADGKNLINSGVTNTVAIYTAAEIAFNTKAGNTYQIQSISSLSGGWQDIGHPIAGTGQTVSYLTPTRDHVQMFFRVITNP